jgi:hypothetical protein
MSTRDLVNRYATVRLTTDISRLDQNQIQMIGVLMEACREMDALFWKQAYGDKEALLSRLQDPFDRRYAEMNYGPWDRLDDDRPFIPGVGSKPKGACFYPTDMTREDLEAARVARPDLRDSFDSLYTLVRRGTRGELMPVPYSIAFRDHLEAAARRLLEAASLARDDGLRRYLVYRAEALMSDDFGASDRAWMDMKTNTIDVVIGPIESYEDKLLGIRASYEGYVLVKDLAWSERLARYAAVLPELQKALPVPDRYKQETPGTDSDLNAYDAVFYAGDCNAGSKTIAINLPNDEEVQLEKGSRRLQLKNVMRAKFDKIMVPISSLLIAEDQRRHVTFDAFFGNTMFHEVAHGLGIKNTINGKGRVREALAELDTVFEEGKADILGLFMVERLVASGDWTEATLEDHYVTFLCGIFRSVRFGASSSHGRANMIRFNFFNEKGAFRRDASGSYRVDMARMKEAIAELSGKILILQGDGDSKGAQGLVDRMGKIGPVLQGDLDRINESGIPVDVVFEQGMEVLLGDA